MNRPGDGEKQSVRLALLGTGWVARQIYLPYLLQSPELQLVAAYDPSSDALAQFASQAGLSSHALTLQACLAQEVEGVLVCSPPSVHAQHIRQIVSAGKFALCEKPVFRHPTELEGAGPLAVVEQKLMGSATMRLRKDVALLLSWVLEGRLGEIQQVRLGWWRERGVPVSGSWRTDPEVSPLGVMEDLGPHLLDLLAWLLSRKVWRSLELTDATLHCRYGKDPNRSASWFASSASSAYEVPDQGSVHFLSDTGTKIEVTVHWADDQPGDHCSLVFQGSRGTASLEGLLGLSTLRRSPLQRCCLRLKEGSEEIHDFPCGPELQLQAFADSIDIFAGFCRALRSPDPGFVEICQVMEWLNKIAARNGIDHANPARL